MSFCLFVRKLKYYIIVLLFEVQIGSAQNCAAACDLYGNYCYVYGSSAIDNPTAQSFCTNAGGQLPFFRLQSDLADYNNYKSSKLGTASTWLGYWNYNGHSASNPGTWSDANGAGNSASFTVWSTGQPDDAGGGEKCVQTLSGDSWNDIPCTGYPFYAVCMCKCPPVAAIANGQTINAVFPIINAVTTFSCNPGYKLVGPSSISCIYAGPGIKWSASPPVCQRMQCSDWFTRVVGSIQAAPFYAGLNYVYTCNPNFVLNGGATLSATYNCDLTTGAWIQPAFVACAATCPKIYSLANATITSVGETVMLPGRMRIGSQTSFFCDTNYLLEGTANITCTSNGNWSNIAPICNPTCAKIFNITFGTVSTNGDIIFMPTRNKLGSQTSFICDVDYLMVGTANVTCTSNGNWSDNVPICDPTCGKIFNISFGAISTNGDITFMPTRNKLGSVSNLTCNSAYYMVGNSTVTCTTYGNWSDRIPACLPIPIEGIWWIWPFVVGLLSFICLCCNFWAFIWKRKKNKKEAEKPVEKTKFQEPLKIHTNANELTSNNFDTPPQRF